MSLNPVERRMAQLCEAWQAFRAEPAARVLLWQLPESGERLAECFVEAQKHESKDPESPYLSGDLFLLFKEPFVHGLQYSRALKETLRGRYDASADELREQGLPTDWPFDPAATPDTPAWFGEALRSFGSKYHRSLGHVCAVLWPSSLAHAESFVQWVQRLLEVGLPERLRVLVVDTQEHPRFGALAACGDARVRVQALDIDGLALAQETFAHEGGVGPAAVFRNLMMGVVSLLEKGSADQVKARAADALKFARAQRWADQEVALRVLVAGALLKEARHTEAVTVYGAARLAAEDTVAARHPAGHKLVLQTWFGEAAVHLAAGNEFEAARCYDEAATVAQRDANAILAIEAFRMAAFCLARAGEVPAARERGLCAIELGAALKPEARPITTLPVALVDQLRLADADRVLQMQRVKSDLRARLEQVRMQADQRADVLTEQRAPDALAQVDRLRLEGANVAAHQAQRRLDELTGRASATFRDMAARGALLLGETWLVDNDLALPPLHEPEPPA